MLFCMQNKKMPPKAAATAYDGTLIDMLIT